MDPPEVQDSAHLAAVIPLGDSERDDARLAYFLRLVPGWLRLTVEFRHPGWHCEEVFALLQEHGVAYCVMSGAHLPCILGVTTDFAYVRMHGPDHHHLYSHTTGASP